MHEALFNVHISGGTTPQAEENSPQHLLLSMALDFQQTFVAGSMKAMVSHERGHTEKSLTGRNHTSLYECFRTRTGRRPSQHACEYLLGSSIAQVLSG
jgi:hypothetical protein